MLKSKFKEIMKNLEMNMKDSKDLAYAKMQMTELTMEYIGQLEKLESLYAQKLSMFEAKLDGLEMTVQKIDHELFQEEMGDTDLEPIKCPYCNTNFFIEFDETKKEIKCPDCRNMIELDWGNFEDDM